MLPRPDAAARLTGRPSQPRGSAQLSRRDLWTGVDHGSMMSMEFLSAILTWTAIGWLADRWLSTEPWLLVTGAVIGNTAGLYLVWLRSKRMDEEEAHRREQARQAARPAGGGDAAAPSAAGQAHQEGRSIEA